MIKTQVEFTKDEIDSLMTCVWNEQKRIKRIKPLNQKKLIEKLEKLHYKLNAHENDFYS